MPEGNSLNELLNSRTEESKSLIEKIKKESLVKLEFREFSKGNLVFRGTNFVCFYGSGAGFGLYLYCLNGKELKAWLIPENKSGLPIETEDYCQLKIFLKKNFFEYKEARYPSDIPDCIIS